MLAALAIMVTLLPVLLAYSVGSTAAWILETVWLAFLGCCLYIYARRKRVRLRRDQEIQARWVQHRAHMAGTNEPWYDADARHYRHSTCTVKHRSEGAASRCSSRT